MLDLTTHCALCGDKHPEVSGVPWWERTWDGDAIDGVHSGRPDRPELMCRCSIPAPAGQRQQQRRQGQR
jgi:hypothetical protein